MRVVILLLCMEGVAATAQIGSVGRGSVRPQLDWTLGVHRAQPSVSASVQGNKDGRVSQVDTEADLGLQREGSPLGALLEYRTQVHGFRLAYDSYRFQGEQALPRDIFLNGVPYPSGAVVRSLAKMKVYEGLYTYKFISEPEAWVGIDLGAQVLRSDVSAVDLSAGSSQAATPSGTLPQIGISAWTSAAEGLVESRLFYHYLSKRGATYHRYGLDGRAYLYPGFGLRVFYEASKLKAPPGSLQGDLDIHASTTLYGLGLVLRF